MSDWLKFLRHYGPIPRNDNMYDETIQRSARRLGISAIDFEHPYHDRVLKCFDSTTTPVSVILTGTAGDGKTHLCRQVWKSLNGDDREWALDSPYLATTFRYSTGENQMAKITVHIIRDLSAWAPQQGAEWEPEKQELLEKFCKSMFSQGSDDIFLIAANDGQLVESWRRLRETDDVQRARQVFEDLLVEDRQEQVGSRIKFFNLSRADSSDLFDRALDAFLGHSGWQGLKNTFPGEDDLFGPKCPIRHNYELLQTALVRSRLRSLFELCDYNGMHLPIRQILLLLTNAVLGHPDVKDQLMVPADVPRIIKAGIASRASLYNNFFGGNLSENRRQAITIFDYLERFQIGYETSNRIDNILIFGEGDEHVGGYFNDLIAKDTFYGADSRFYAAKREYIEGTIEANESSQEFLQLLSSQRRGLFFKIPKEAEGELRLWELSVFKFAGEYLESVVAVLKDGTPVKRPIVSKLIRGLGLDAPLSMICEVVAPKKTLVREISSDLYLENNALPGLAVERFIKNIEESVDWQRALQENGAFVKCKAILENKVGWREDYDGPTEPTELLAALRQAAMKRHRQHVANIHRNYGRDVGLVSKRGTVKLRYAPTDSLLKTLLFANVDKRMELHQFLGKLHVKYGLVFGDKEAERVLARDEFDKKAFQANSRRLEQRLGSLGLLKRLSDGCAYVLNPYSVETV